MSHIRLRHKIIIVWFVTCEVSITNKISTLYGCFFIGDRRLGAILPWQCGPEENKQPQNVVC